MSHLLKINSQKSEYIELSDTFFLILKIKINNYKGKATSLITVLWHVFKSSCFHSANCILYIWDFEVPIKNLLKMKNLNELIVNKKKD